MWALQGDDGVHIIIGRGFVPVCCPAGCAAMNEDVALLAGVVDTDRFHRRATLGGPIPWQLIHMTGPQAVRAMIAIAAPVCRAILPPHWMQLNPVFSTLRLPRAASLPELTRSLHA